MTVAVELDLRELAARDAEDRLGRRLTEGELHLDIIGYGRDLDRGKAQLAAAIAAELRRALRAHLQRRPADRLRLSRQMEVALLDLYANGRRHARRELRSMGVADDDDPDREYAEGSALGQMLARIQRLRASGEEVPDELAALEPVLVRLNAHLHEIDLRMRKETLGVDLSKHTQARLIEILEAKVPGVLDAAGRLISAAQTAGLASVYEALPEGTFAGWVYSAAMDANTCERCRENDGREFDTLPEALLLLPNFGPNPLCFGDGRCRCRLVPKPVEGAPPADVPPREPEPHAPSALMNVNKMADPALRSLAERAGRIMDDAIGGPLRLDGPERGVDVRAQLLPRNTAEFRSKILDRAAQRYGSGGIWIDKRYLHEPRTPESHRLLTLIHEFGHYLDNIIFGRGHGRRRKETGLHRGISLASGWPELVLYPDEMRDLLRALSDSDLYARYGDVIRNREEAGLRSIFTVEQETRARYLARPSELFARAFAQWVASRAADDEEGRSLRQQIERRSDLRDLFSWYWTWEDFAPISDALDRLFDRAREG